MAAEGLRFTPAMPGPLCAPSRCALLTGRHTGHARMRDNAGGTLNTLAAEDKTVAEVLKAAGYATAWIGKWGQGSLGGTGDPTRKGFDHFFGYIDQGAAHFHLPAAAPTRREGCPAGSQRRRQAGAPTPTTCSRRMPSGTSRTTGTGRSSSIWRTRFRTRITRRVKQVTEFRGMEVPDYGPYKDKDWPGPQKGHAWISRMDADVGRLLDRLAKLGIDGKTIVLFSSGRTARDGDGPAGMDSRSRLRRNQAFAARRRDPCADDRPRWPSHVRPLRQAICLAYSRTFCRRRPNWPYRPAAAAIDRILAGTDAARPTGQEQHEYSYWEFFEKGATQAMRWQVKPRTAEWASRWNSTT